ncbi:DNA-binding response regulator [Methylopila jiangsuensis]|uniref:DNA-binding response regulator n=1 Tax=Methylopila jiangsuensis TaxID=586230 RepID=A0A9W6JFJ2_9HYPH|nr:two-component system phosphate regulon response regulator OmpR [Methylopila jiangsuensis]GLK75089.1 DNA-binding response regulator [Methylopila jiangsuensis]
MSVAGASQPAPTDAAAHLLIVDDDARIRALLQKFLAGKGYRVTVAADAAEARAKLDALAFDLLVLDVMMPGESGLDLARAIRARSAVPILMLTARSDAEDRIEGLETGADDYLPKPFDPRELLLRISGILRRAGAAAMTSEPEVRFGGFAFHRGRGELKRGDEVVRLTDRERDLLAALAERPGQTVPRSALAGDDVAPGDRAVDVVVTRLRRKIEDDPAQPLLLQTVRGLGYRLLADA